MIVKFDGMFINLSKFEHFLFSFQPDNQFFNIIFEIYKKTTDEEPVVTYLSTERLSTWEAADRCLFCVEELFADYLKKEKFCDVQDLVETQIKVSHLRVKIETPTA